MNERFMKDKGHVWLFCFWWLLIWQKTSIDKKLLTFGLKYRTNGTKTYLNQYWANFIW